jgi:hypothetical protein
MPRKRRQKYFWFASFRKAADRDLAAVLHELHGLFDRHQLVQQFLAFDTLS